MAVVVQGLPSKHPPVSQSFTSSGTFTIQPWMNYIDRIVLGAAGCGGAYGPSGCSFVNGNGGTAGSWASDTIQRGVSFPSGTTLTITVGTGAIAGGGDTTATSSAISGTGATTLTGAAGTNGTDEGGGSETGLSPGNHTYNGVTYSGGGSVGADTNGQSPGGAGGGSDGGSGPGNGANGEVWIVARSY